MPYISSPPREFIYTVLLIITTRYFNSSCVILLHILVVQLFCLEQSTKMEDTTLYTIPQLGVFY
ncbi:hypothetical protein PITC_013220 [Penicillium italicum]|uniref:Uncharacterized protein n=1 Tax=Penicillium italicum TaxID=40296 RepID=A0A0A2K809_PENIT|nr:hypothetical protein PITC_013220 [Penicillium italicum]